MYQVVLVQDNALGGVWIESEHQAAIDRAVSVMKIILTMSDEDFDQARNDLQAGWEYDDNGICVNIIKIEDGRVTYNLPKVTLG